MVGWLVQFKVAYKWTLSRNLSQLTSSDGQRTPTIIICSVWNQQAHGFPYIFGICNIFMICGKQIPQTMWKQAKVIYHTYISCLLYLVKFTYSFLRQKISTSTATMLKYKKFSQI